MKFVALLLSACVSLSALYLLWQNLPLPLPANWTAAELQSLQSLSLANLPDMPADPSNRFNEDLRAAQLGQQLFFDQRLSSTGTLACADCHQAGRLFTDGRRLGIGTAEGDRHTPGLLGVAYSPWHYWDGRKDSLWSQALEPLENPLEQANNRTDLLRFITTDPDYANAFSALLGPLPDLSDTTRFPAGATPLGNPSQRELWNSMRSEDRATVSTLFAALGKMLAAYERRLLPGPAPFDRYVESLQGSTAIKAGDSVLSSRQLAGLRLFIGKAQCLNCHNGPLFTNQDFHNTGLLSAPGMLPGLGRSAGLRTALEDEFNCQGPFSDAVPGQCVELRFARRGDENLGAMKTPGLRNVADTAPYMHAGQIATLAEVLRHYDAALPAMVGHNEAMPLGLRAVERRQLEAFLHSLSAPPTANSLWLRPPDSGLQ